MRTELIGAGLVLVAALSGTLAVAPAHAIERGSAAASMRTSSTSPVDDETISFSVIGGAPLVEGEPVTIDELQTRGLSSDQLTDVGELVTPTPAPEAAAAGVAPLAAGPYDIISSWTAGDGKSVILRRQAYDKIVTKHNLTTAVVKRATTNYTNRFQEGAGSTVFHYTIPVSEIQCNGLGCWVVKTLTVEAVVDYRSLGAGKLTYGVVTTYCVGVAGACPSWVKNAINA